MKKNLGFSSFEFYFVVAVIGVVLLFGVHRYNKLADEAHRLSFEVLAQNFSAAVYAQHARWIISQQIPDSRSILDVENRQVQFSSEGWPIGVDLKSFSSTNITLPGCLSLWMAFLQNAPAISVASGDTSIDKPYRIQLLSNGSCHYEWVTPNDRKFHFEYFPITGLVKFQD